MGVESANEGGGEELIPGVVFFFFPFVGGGGEQVALELSSPARRRRQGDSYIVISHHQPPTARAVQSIVDVATGAFKLKPPKKTPLPHHIPREHLEIPVRCTNIRILSIFPPSIHLFLVDKVRDSCLSVAQEFDRCRVLRVCATQLH